MAGTLVVIRRAFHIAARCQRNPSMKASAIVERLEPRLLLFAAAVGSETLVNSHTAGNQSNSCVAMDNAGDYVVTWSSEGQESSGLGIFAQRYSAAGIAQGGEFRVNTYTTGNQMFPSVAMDATGDLARATRRLVEHMRVTIFGRYRCHQPRPS